MMKMSSTVRINNVNYQKKMYISYINIMDKNSKLFIAVIAFLLFMMVCPTKITGIKSILGYGAKKAVKEIAAPTQKAAAAKLAKQSMPPGAEGFASCPEGQNCPEGFASCPEGMDCPEGFANDTGENCPPGIDCFAQTTPAPDEVNPCANGKLENIKFKRINTDSTIPFLGDNDPQSDMPYTGVDHTWQNDSHSNTQLAVVERDPRYGAAMTPRTVMVAGGDVRKVPSIPKDPLAKFKLMSQATIGNFNTGL